MNISGMRKWHRSIGIVLALFIMLQAGSGLLLTISEFSETSAHTSEGHGHDENSVQSFTWHTVLGWIHHSESIWMGVYRILLGVGILAQTVIGVMIFIETRQRVKSRKS
ncbi:MAG: hypothetical protein R6U55_00990 [Desulfovermiculus sp.]